MIRRKEGDRWDHPDEGQEPGRLQRSYFSLTHCCLVEIMKVVQDSSSALLTNKRKGAPGKSYLYSHITMPVSHTWKEDSINEIQACARKIKVNQDLPGMPRRTSAK
jgi:hypothetical protein